LVLNMAYQKQYKETLQNICSFSFPANHLVNFQLVRAIPNNTVTQNSTAKSEYFSFITIAPGEVANENRTYNFQNKITIKFSLQEIAGLSFVLKTCANGMGKVALPYTKFARSGQGSKTVSVWEPAPAQQTQDNIRKARAINITIKENNTNGFTIAITPDQAFAISESLNELFKKGISLEFERQINTPKVTSNQENSNSYNTLKQNSTPLVRDNSIAGNIFDSNNDFSQIQNEFENMLLSN